MRFAVRIHQDGWSYQELEAVWRESERLGYDGASLYDVLGINGPECWTALTALTARTRKLVAVPLVLSGPYRHPAVMARMAATLDAVSPGRVIVGWYQLRDAPAYRDTARAEGLPILIGGHGQHLLRTAARHADLCNIGFDLTPGEWRRLGPMLAADARQAQHFGGLRLFAEAVMPEL